MKRYAEEYLNKWFIKKRRKPLVIRGARQVGKSTLVRNFANNYNLELVEINLEKHKNLNKLFETKNIKEICREIEYLTNSNFAVADKKLLFLDEIQATPEAIPCLRYFYEDFPELAVISAGSLLEFTLSKHNFSMPVGRIEYFYLGPMNFIEFLMAEKQWQLIELLDGWPEENIPESAHERLSSLLRDFIFVGGMPEAVSVYIENRNLADVIDVHLSILETYQDDFSKYARDSQLSLLQNVFRYVPKFLGNKVKYSNIDQNVQAREVKAAIDLLAKAGVITKVHHSNASGLPLGAEVNSRIYKLYFLDIGLVNTMCGVRHLSLETLRDVRFINEGNLAEQFIAQHLLYIGRSNAVPELLYWLREGRTGNAEVDFILPVNGEIIPVEVKAGKSGALKSLHQFVENKKCKKAYRFDLNRPSKQIIKTIMTDRNSEECDVEYELLSFPLYMVQKVNWCFES